jgi:hypothetical protein
MPKRLFKPDVREVAKQEYDSPAVQNAAENAERLADARGFGLRLEEQHFSDQAQHMAYPFARWNKTLDTVREVHEANAIVIADGAKSHHCGQLGGNLPLLLAAAAEGLTRASIDGHDDSQLALLHEALHEGVAHARGDVPVNGANVVPRLVFANLLECDAGAFENTAVFPSQKVLDRATRSQLESADLTKQIGGEHVEQSDGCKEDQATILH